VGALSLSGFVIGALIAIKVVPQLVDDLNLAAGLQRSFVVLAAVLLFAWLGQLGGALLGARLRDTLTFRPIQLVDQLLGALAGVIAVSLVLWFVGGALRVSPSTTLASTVASSKVLNTINALMPARVSNLAENLRAAVADSSFPRVFAGVTPERIVSVPNPDPGAMPAAVLSAARRSIVKVTGEAQACSRNIEGSGAVISPRHVVTNAHVVAGMRSPSVQVGGKGAHYSAQVVLFDPKRDIAVLYVPYLTAPAIAWGGNLDQGADAVVAGFPRNGSFTSGAARVRSVLQATGGDIYGGTGVLRQVYQLYAEVEPGNSGGPLLAVNGSLAGIVFAKSLDDPNTGYALTMDESRSDIDAGRSATAAVTTSQCAAG
jgi:S1-C subfamily serine protease